MSFTDAVACVFENWLLDAGYWRIRLTPVTLHRIWLAGFTLWRAVQAYAGPLWLMDQLRWPLDFAKLGECPGQLEADAAYDQAVQWLEDLKAQGGEFRGRPTSRALETKRI